jgi:glycosyltransferase involved in cell wall biosynthesis
MAILNRVAVLIPVWQPGRDLVDLVSSLLALSFPAVIVVNDGSDSDRDAIFEEIRKDGRVRILSHAVNLGKGRALKTGLNEFLNQYPGFSGLVTCDADGQHRPGDVLLVAEAMETSPGVLILGSREFKPGIPLRSRFGNILTKYVFALLTGRKLGDTQSGLRGIPKQTIPKLLRLDGEGYEFEMNVLAEAANSCGIAEVPIETVYIDGNRSSHFNPVWDSMRIYFVLVRFYLSSLVSTGIDFVVFTIVFWATANLPASMIAGRVSSLANFFLNRRFVFSSSDGLAFALGRYYVLVALIALASYSGIRLLSGNLGMNVLVAKVLVETCLSLVSFSLQRTFVFDSRTKG